MSRLVSLLVCGLLVSTAVAAAQSAGTFAPTGSMATARAGHSATLLPDGRVLIAGGASRNLSILATTEIYDPTVGIFRAAAPLDTARRMHTATLLPDDKVLIVGG